MPKMKTRKCVAKRVKMTGTGKYVHSRVGGRHILTKKSAKRKRRIGRDATLKSTERNRLKSALPYGL
jgi:large subunit ribosomal protein L35